MSRIKSSHLLGERVIISYLQKKICVIAKFLMIRPAKLVGLVLNPVVTYFGVMTKPRKYRSCQEFYLITVRYTFETSLISCGTYNSFSGWVIICWNL